MWTTFCVSGFWNLRICCFSPVYIIVGRISLKLHNVVLGKAVLIRRENSLLFDFHDWINKLFSEDNTISYCVTLFIFAVPPVWLQTVLWGRYSPLRTDSLFSYGLFVLHFFSETTMCTFLSVGVGQMKSKRKLCEYFSFLVTFCIVL